MTKEYLEGWCLTLNYEEEDSEWHPGLLKTRVMCLRVKQIIMYCIYFYESLCTNIYMFCQYTRERGGKANHLWRGCGDSSTRKRWADVFTFQSMTQEVFFSLSKHIQPHTYTHTHTWDCLFFLKPACESGHVCTSSCCVLCSHDNSKTSQQGHR